MKKYTVLMYDGIGGGSLSPEPPAEDNQAASIAEATRMFGTWMRASGNDYQRAEGYGQPPGDVIHTASWDGISYGDVTGGTGVCRLERGPRGGVIRQDF